MVIKWVFVLIDLTKGVLDQKYYISMLCRIEGEVKKKWVMVINCRKLVVKYILKEGTYTHISVYINVSTKAHYASTYTHTYIYIYAYTHIQTHTRRYIWYSSFNCVERHHLYNIRYLNNDAHDRYCVGSLLIRADRSTLIFMVADVLTPNRPQRHRQLCVLTCNYSGAYITINK